MSKIMSTYSVDRNIPLTSLGKENFYNQLVRNPASIDWESISQDFEDIPSLGSVSSDYINEASIFDSVKVALNLKDNLSINYLKDYNYHKLKKLNGLDRIVSKVGLESRLMIQVDKNDGAYFSPYINCCLNGNKLFRAIACSKLKIESLDGNSNYLDPRQLYWLGSVANNLLIDELQDSLVFGRSIHDNIVNKLDLSLDCNNSLHSFYHIEVCLNLKTDSRTHFDFNNIIDECSSRFSVIYIKRIENDGPLLGARFEISQGEYLVIYYKTPLIIRVEHILKKKNIRKISDPSKYLNASKFLENVANQSRLLFREILLRDRFKEAKMNAQEADKELRTIIKEKHYKPILRALTEGNGFLKVKSTKSRALYSEVRRLFQKGVLIKEPKRSVYSLNLRYWSIINEDGIVTRVFRGRR